MVSNVNEVRGEWAARVSKQFEEMISIAFATRDDRIRSELLGFAERLEEQAARIRSLSAC